VRAYGDVISGERTGWFRRVQSVEMRPGGTIVLPLYTERVRALPLRQAVTMNICNLAVALMAVRSVSPAARQTVHPKATTFVGRDHPRWLITPACRATPVGPGTRGCLSGYM
jgi:hypothetical protein